MTPISDDALDEFRVAERKDELAREKAGLPRFFAETPAVRFFGPLWPILDVDATEIPIASNRHPFGPNRRKYRSELVICESQDGWN